jgi:hypothetical protein
MQQVSSTGCKKGHVMQHKTGIVSMIALSSFLLCGASAPTDCKGSFGPSTGEVVGIGVAIGATIVIGTVVLVHVNHSHHEIRGCVTSGPNGLQVENESDKKIYTLIGVPSNVKVGDIVKVHGDKEKQAKGSPANQDFKVEKMSKDYGPCKVSQTPASPS